jgi:hypothetical protein
MINQMAEQNSCLTWNPCDLLHFSQETVTGTYLEPDETSSRPMTTFLSVSLLSLLHGFKCKRFRNTRHIRVLTFEYHYQAILETPCITTETRRTVA